MMSVALDVRNRYEDLDIKKDVIFFRLGAPGLVCFHGTNYNIRKRMTGEQIQELIHDASFFKVGSDCYVNIGRIADIENDRLYFGEKGPESKSLPVSKRNQQTLRSLIASGQ
ncbi:LytTR family transcriptional regulator DNA-binding domain-containing protein [Paenibacillus tarimensis]|uniref:LytTR family transcriptional regulator DNA-binding domain-containing protein n=1 Tax=Paenibacillus tarimensis TaxID=416012 RepID=UPI001F16AF95|nr:LytTR family transcriptional regulator DNA-binding domain-containing protein [Paenibacillus tarimensis]MCF2943692.1 LytTR family transcriptional regulator DNA-binding domain-containing protein [Paenibacillus tarimensis]